MPLHSPLFLLRSVKVFLVNACTLSRFAAGFTSSHSHPSLPPLLSSPPTASECAAAWAWLRSFREASIPRGDVELMFARSSGPGGQNVNKVNTKATVRCSLDKTWIPVWARDKLSAYVRSSNSLLVTSTLFRSQAQNVEDCFEKLQAIINNACVAAIPTPAEPARLARKEGYARAANLRRLAEKGHRSAVKKGRRGGDGGE